MNLNIKISELSAIFNTASRIAAVKAIMADKKNRNAKIHGLSGSAISLLLSALPKQKNPYLIIADDFDSAGYIYHDLSQICGETSVGIFPSGYKRDIKFGQVDQPSKILRTDVLNSWDKGKKKWVVTCPEALAEKVPNPNSLTDSTINLSISDRVAISDMVHRLLEQGFHEVDYVYEPGQYARRGSILDVYSYSNELPYRIDFFDDEIDSIRLFNVETQLSEQKLDSISIISEISSTNSSDDISFLDFISESTIIFCESKEWLLSRVKHISEESISESVLIANEGDCEALSRVVDYSEFEKRLNKSKIIEFGHHQSLLHEDTSSAKLTIECSPQTLFHKNFELISENFRKKISEGYTIYILSDSSNQTERLKAIFEDRRENINFIAVEKTLHQGFIDHENKKCFFTDHQIFDRFHKYSLKSDKARSGKLALSIKELNQIEVGDYIVHIDHGIGKFGGLVRTNVNGSVQEMIKLTYLNDDIIFVSIHALHKLSKYRAKEGVPPKINKLGSGAWNKLKERTKSKMKDIARDLIKLYAARREEKGFAFSQDSYLQHELEASFIYEDTPDQLKATQAVKADMESARPMDRLICGDVGFGKTEVAIRAAFKAAVDGKQTAVLVPTTVLALQHYKTFSTRLADLPVRVDFISRARKAKEIKQIIEDLASGKIDILIGTHKIIGKEIKFKDLGLLIIDEEQKFGVSVKEKLKQMKVNVDTLTMSATPIPRTLQFSLMGARDLSNINTPPANRQPIVTNVVAYNDNIISEAVNFELSRNGQVFFICNRIEQLANVENTLRRLIPDVRVITAHGQMSPENLEKAIVDFANHDYDVLLSTTIIESGIDMPNVNTMIINNAQNFGLSELHQLRGRVGRSARKAFCYMLVPPFKELTPVARRRLQAIENFSDLGSGIHIAMQDLDIRGAGNLLGAEQSGFIADLGYEAYQKILKESVIELKTEEFADTFADENANAPEEFVADCIIESDMELRIPADYVPQEGERISLYQELDNMEHAEQIKTFRDKLKDRFGEIPNVTEELIKIVPLRSIAKQIGVERLYLKQNKMFLYFVDETNQAYYHSAAFGRVLSYLQLNVKECELRDKNGKRSMVIANVDNVSLALDILSTIQSLPSI